MKKLINTYIIDTGFGTPVKSVIHLSIINRLIYPNVMNKNMNYGIASKNRSKYEPK